MISYTISNGINGIPCIPGDKSISHRSIIIPSISNGICEVNNLLKSDDVLHTLEAFKNLGVKIDQRNDKVVIYGIDKPYQYALVDLLGRTKQKGFIRENQAEIIFQKSLKSGMYVLKLQNEYNACSGRVLVLN